MDIQFTKMNGALLPILIGATSSERRRFRLNRKTLQATFRNRDFTGLKVMAVDVGNRTYRTPHGLKVVANRRRRNKLARASRKGNR